MRRGSRGFVLFLVCLGLLGGAMTPTESLAEPVAFAEPWAKSGLLLIDGQYTNEQTLEQAFSWAKDKDDGFPAYPAFVSFAEEIRSALNQDGLQVGLLRIVRLPITDYAPRVDFLEAPAAGELCVDSPWARLFRAEGRIGGHILWSERQFLRDRLGRGDWETPPLPFSGMEIRVWVEAYAATIIGEKNEEAARIPTDLNRLFQEAVQTTRRPFGGEAMRKMHRISEEMSGVYAEPIIHMIRHCAKGGPPMRLQKPADLAAAFGPSAYGEFSE